jgi:hypothetical protein
MLKINGFVLRQPTPEKPEETMVSASKPVAYVATEEPEPEEPDICDTCTTSKETCPLREDMVKVYACVSYSEKE